MSAVSEQQLTYEQAYNVVCEQLASFADAAYDEVSTEVENFFASRDAGTQSIVKYGFVDVPQESGAAKIRAEEYSGDDTIPHRYIPGASWTTALDETYAPLERARHRLERYDPSPDDQSDLYQLAAETESAAPLQEEDDLQQLTSRVDELCPSIDDDAPLRRIAYSADQ